MFEDTAKNLTVIAAQLIDAACCAKAGDSNTAQARIERAMQLLTEQRAPTVASTSVPELIARGALAAWQLRRVKNHIEAHLGQRIRLDDLAGLVKLSGSHFSRAFKCSVGTTAQSYIMRRRIEYAQGLMLTTQSPLSEIALACGMSDQSHFTRSFRRVVEQSPMAWRRSRIGEADDAFQTRARS